MDNTTKGSVRNFFLEKPQVRAYDPEDGDRKCYPNCDSTIWLRSCEKEIIEPICGQVQGTIPKWLNGSLLRNGPGNYKVGDMRYRHLFDSSALVHRFYIKNGQVTYQCRFIQTETYKRNMTAKRIIIAEFGSEAVPDPCHSIFQKISAVFKAGETTDNTMVSVYPLGDEYFTFMESPVIHKINPVTLATEGRVVVSDYVGIATHTSHPHIMKDGTAFNLGLSINKTGPVYHVICFPCGERMFENAHIAATIPCRWKLNPGYMHTFGVTKNYFVIVEQPLSISCTRWMKTKLTNEATASSLRWFENEYTYFYLVEKTTGNVKATYKSEAFFYLHIINQYEKDDYIIVDIVCYKDPDMINCMYVESMMNMQSNPNYAAMFRSRALRFILPAPSDHSGSSTLVKSSTFANIFSLFQPKIEVRRSESESQDIRYSNFTVPNSTSCDITGENLCKNLINLPNTKAQAFRMADDLIFLKPELLCDMGMETPRINYEKYLGVPYRYFYAISCDVDAENVGTLIKVDTVTKTKKTWCETNCYPSEPIFVPSPDSKSEDDGVILSAMVWGNLDENRVGLLVLCARNWTELGRCEFVTPGPVPKCLHGWFAGNT